MTTTPRILGTFCGLLSLLSVATVQAQQPAPPAESPYAPAAGQQPPAYPPPPSYYGAQPYPAQPGGATTNYHVLYPQRRGALPPGMELPYYEGQEIPPGYHLVTRPRRGLVTGGAITMGIPWALSVSIASGYNFENSSGWLVVPGLGPWLMLLAGGAKDHCDYSYNGECLSNSGGDLRGILVLDGLVQTAGLVMLASGLYFPTKRLVRGDVTVSMLPSRVGAEGYGLGLSGTF